MKYWTLFLIAILAVFAVACGGVNDNGNDDNLDDTSDDDNPDDDSGDDDNGNNADDDDSDDDDNVDDDDDDDDSGDDDDDDDDSGDDDDDDDSGDDDEHTFAVDLRCPAGVVCVSYTYDYGDNDVGVEMTHRWSDEDWEYLEWYSWDYAEGDALWVCADDPDADLEDFDIDDEDGDSSISYTLAYADEGDCAGGTEIFVVPTF